MRDTNNIEIKEGMLILTKQYSGGILHPSTPNLGRVVLKESINKHELMAECKSIHNDCIFYILLDGKINTILNGEIRNINTGICHRRVQADEPSFFVNWQQSGNNMYEFFISRFECETFKNKLKNYEGNN